MLTSSIGIFIYGSSYQFWNEWSIPLPILHLFSFSWQIALLQILSSYIFYFGQTNPIKVRTLTLSRPLVIISQTSHVIFESKNQFSFKFCINIQWHQTYLPLAQTLYTLVKGSLLKCRALRFSSARIKIWQIIPVNF